MEFHFADYLCSALEKFCSKQVFNVAPWESDNDVLKRAPFSDVLKGHIAELLRRERLECKRPLLHELNCRRAENEQEGWNWTRAGLGERKEVSDDRRTKLFPSKHEIAEKLGKAVKDSYEWMLQGSCV